MILKTKYTLLTITKILPSHSLCKPKVGIILSGIYIRGIFRYQYDTAVRTTCMCTFVFIYCSVTIGLRSNLILNFLKCSRCFAEVFLMVSQYLNAVFMQDTEITVYVYLTRASFLFTLMFKMHFKVLFQAFFLLASLLLTHSIHGLLCLAHSQRDSKQLFI